MKEAQTFGMGTASTVSPVEALFSALAITKAVEAGRSAPFNFSGGDLQRCSEKLAPRIFWAR